MLRIQRAANGKVVFTLSGRIEPEDIDELRRLFGLEPAAVHIVLNLKELVLVNGDGVEFLAGCEAAGMTLENCPAYVRKWIEQQRG
jgi:sugar/nucleoside kinase (ribokinase family)